MTDRKLLFRGREIMLQERIDMSYILKLRVSLQMANLKIIVNRNSNEMLINIVFHFQCNTDFINFLCHTNGSSSSILPDMKHSI